MATKQEGFKELDAGNFPGNAEQAPAERAGQGGAFAPSADLSSIGALAGALDHDLRNAINVIKTASYYLRTRLAEADARIVRQLELIDTGCVNAVQLLTQLSDFGQSYQREFVVQPMGPVLQQAVESCGAARSRVTLDVHDDLPTIPLDSVSLCSAFAGLIKRALERTPADQGVFVCAARAGRGVRVSIEDHGPPLSPSYQESLFKRADASSQNRPGNLPNAVVREIIAHHGGEIRCETGSDLSSQVVIDLNPSG